jgi:TRAP-type mannitol/chloroaromatic compound transport system permease large subunit
MAPSEPPLTEGEQPSLLEKIRVTSVALVPTIVLIVTVIGTVLWGVATPTESAACGCVGALGLAAFYRGLNYKVFVEALYTTLSITALIMLVVLAGSIFSTVFYASGGMTGVQNILDALGIANWQAIMFILVLGFLGGFILDLISVTFILIPVAMPLVASAGVDPIWFCVLFLFVLQTSYLSPPMAPSIFYLRAIAPPDIRLVDMYRGVVPFIALQVVTILLILAFPGLATWLPEVLYIR